MPRGNTADGGLMQRRATRPGEAGDERICELIQVKALDVAYELATALRERGIDAIVWQAGSRCGRCTYVTGRGLAHLTVPWRDLTYARWIVHGAEMDAWPA
jgi:hypothetical protein